MNPYDGKVDVGQELSVLQNFYSHIIYNPIIS